MLNLLRRHIVKVLGRRVDISPSEDAMNHYRSGVAASNAGRHEDALKEFTNAILVARVDSHMNHHRGRALAELGRHEEAIFDYDAAVRANPSYPDTYLDRGNAHHALGHLETALKDYSEAIRLRPDFAESYANRAVIYVELADPAAADADAARARDLGVDRSRLEELMRDATTTRRTG